MVLAWCEHEDEQQGDDDDGAPKSALVTDERLALARTGDLSAVAEPTVLAALAKEFCDYYAEDKQTQTAAIKRVSEASKGSTHRGCFEQCLQGPQDAMHDNIFVACVDAARYVEIKEKQVDGIFGVRSELKRKKVFSCLLEPLNWIVYYIVLPFRWLEMWLDVKHKGEESPWEFDELSVTEKVSFLINLPFKWIFFLTIPNCGNPRFENWYAFVVFFLSLFVCLQLAS